MKIIPLVASVALLSAPILQLHAEESMMNFDFTNGEITEGFGNWFYSDKGSNPCDVFGGENQSKLCSTSGYKLYQYYNWNNSDHLGWMRYGYIDSSSDFSVSGSSLEIALTGGQYEDAGGEIKDSGAFIKSKSDLANYGPDELFSDKSLKGDLSLYFKTPSATTKIPELAGKNRFSVWVLMPKGIIDIDKYNYAEKTRPSQYFAWYPFIDTSKSGHYYHHASNIPMGGWTKVQFDAHPTHHNSGSNNLNSGFSEGGDSYPGDGASYMSNIAAFSLRAGFTKDTASPISYYIDEMTTDFVMYENEETISNVGVGYNPDSHLFDISFEDKYRCADCSAKYEVRYSFYPITNANFHNASKPLVTTNFKRSQSNNDGIIHKPNPGYNIIWAGLDLQPDHRDMLTDNKDIFFAIKDISERQIVQQAADFELVDVPDVGMVRKMDLIKTIKYTTIPVSYPIEITTDSLEPMIMGHRFNQKIEATGQNEPYVFESISLPAGMSLSRNGILSGIPQQKGDFNLSLRVLSSNGKTTSKNFSINIKTESDYDFSKCSEIVDFKSSKAESVISNSNFNTVIHDSYTGFDELGASIFVGNNKDYNYQGVTGNGMEISAGDKIIATYINTSEQTIVFTPKVSLNDPDRLYSGVSGDWYEMSQTTAPEDTYVVSEITITESMALSATTININTQHDSSKTLILDKIAFVDSDGDPENICEYPFKESSKNVYIAVDFNNSDNDSVTGIPGWEDIVIDQYSGYLDSGVTTILGSNPEYNYQGVTGVPRELSAGTEVFVYWKNISSQAITASPKISFDDSNRVYLEPTGTWYDMEPTTIDAYSEKVGKFVIDENNTSIATGININSNTSNNKSLVLDKIEVVSQIPIYDITTTSLEEQIVGHYSEQQIEALGGEPPYFFYSEDEMPSGTYLSTEGMLFGTPSETYDGNINISSIDNQGVISTKEFALTIKNENSFNVSHCELIVDFNDSESSSVIASPFFQNIIKDTYTNYDEHGITVTVGDNQYYNYQGVIGQDFALSTGNEVRIVWYNNSEESITFTPYISFDDPDRKDFGVDGNWHYVGKVTVPPNSYEDSLFSITPELEGGVSVININSSYKNNRVLYVDKIEFVNTELSENDICSLPF